MGPVFWSKIEWLRAFIEKESRFRPLTIDGLSP